MVPVQKMKQPNELWAAFEKMMKNEVEMKSLLEQKIPAYVEAAREGGRKLAEVLVED